MELETTPVFDQLVAERQLTHGVLEPPALQHSADGDTFYACQCGCECCDTGI